MVVLICSTEHRKSADKTSLAIESVPVLLIPYNMYSWVSCVCVCVSEWMSWKSTNIPCKYSLYPRLTQIVEKAFIERMPHYNPNAITRWIRSICAAYYSRFGPVYSFRGYSIHKCMQAYRSINSCKSCITIPLILVGKSKMNKNSAENETLNIFLFKISRNLFRNRFNGIYFWLNFFLLFRMCNSSERNSEYASDEKHFTQMARAIFIPFLMRNQ